MANRVLVSILACFVVTGCQNVGFLMLAPITPISAETVVHVRSTSAELGRGQFASGNFALAERNFREAVEINPDDFESWVGLAAAYDNLARFELADRAYSQAIRIGGETIELVNNLGYSYLLRGDRVKARAQFERALQLDPTNAVIANNIRLLSENNPRAGRRIR